jgi:hypothetical protein
VTGGRLAAFALAALAPLVVVVLFGTLGMTEPHPPTTTTTTTRPTTTTINAPGTLECSAGPGHLVRTGAVEGARLHDCRPA